MAGRDADGGETARAIAYLSDLYDNLSACADLSPDNRSVTLLLTGFVRQLAVWHATGVGADLPHRSEIAALASGLPELCGRAETLMEKWWCRRLLQAPGALAVSLPTFWYYGSYCRLVAAERRLLTGSPQGRIVFLGSGALPLTAILLTEQTGCEIACVDHDGEACALSRGLVARAGFSARITVQEMEAAHFPFEAEDLVLCASLLSGTEHHAALLAARVPHVIVRDAEGVFRFCYRPAEPLPSPYSECTARRRMPGRSIEACFMEIEIKTKFLANQLSNLALYELTSASMNSSHRRPELGLGTSVSKVPCSGS